MTIDAANDGGDTMKTIETRRLTKEYRIKAISVKALRGVDFIAEPGEFVAIAGPSGSGKSSFLNLIGCLDSPTDGEILLEGRNVASLEPKELARIRRERIGFIFQAFNLVPVLTAQENVAFPLTLLGRGRKEARERSRAALKAVGLEGLEDRRPAELSGGQQQRVAIARSLVKEPAIVLADEPTANLDSATGQEILELMRNMNREKKTTFLLCTHDQMVMEAADRVVRMRDGLIAS
jgi:putative ABC transport system ATP-binding protein